MSSFQREVFHDADAWRDVYRWETEQGNLVLDIRKGKVNYLSIEEPTTELDGTPKKTSYSRQYFLGDQKGFVKSSLVTDSNSQKGLVYFVQNNGFEPPEDWALAEVQAFLAKTIPDLEETTMNALRDLQTKSHHGDHLHKLNPETGYRDVPDVPSIFD